jgi:hypothetical protein
MFICNKKDKEIKFFDGKSLKEIMWDFDSIFSVIKKNITKLITSTYDIIETVTPVTKKIY